MESQTGTQVSMMPKDLPPRQMGQLRTFMKGLATREMVFARAMLLVEDESQRNLIVSLAHKLSYDLDSYSISIVNVDGHDGFQPYITFAEALQLAYICLRDKPWDATGQKPPAVFRTLGCELEEYLEKAGFGSLMKEAEREVDSNKRRVAKYVGEHASAEAIPSLISGLIRDAIRLAQLPQFHI